MALNLNPEIALRLRKARHRLASTMPNTSRDEGRSAERTESKPPAYLEGERERLVEDIDQILDDSILKQNQRAIAAHLDDDYYVRSLTPGMFVPFATAAHGTAGQSAGLGKWPTIDYPDGASSYAVAAFRRPKFWVSGKIEVTIYYTSQTAGTANFSILLSVGTVPQPGNLSNTGITTLVTTTIATAGPTAADDEKVVSTYTTTSLNPSMRRVFVRIGRDGAADANNSVLQVTEVVLRHIPAQQEVDVR
jgi:hypothetical protein